MLRIDCPFLQLNYTMAYSTILPYSNIPPSPQMVDFHIRFAQSKGLSAQLDIHHHELSLDAAQLDLHTHLPLPQIFIKGEKVS